MAGECNLTDTQLEEILRGEEFWTDFSKNNEEHENSENENSDEECDDSVNTKSQCSSNEAPSHNDITVFRTICEDGEESDCDKEDKEIFSEHDTSSEQEQDSDDDNDQLSVNSAFYGKDKTKWAKNAPVSHRTPAHNIVTVLPGLIGPAKQNPPSSPLEAWNLLLPDAMLQTIVDHTNKKIRLCRTNYKKVRRTRFGKTKYTPTFIGDIDIYELKALLGLFYLSGIFKSAHEDIRSLWATDGTGRDIFRCTMSLARFSFLLSALRLDDIDTRKERLKNSKLAAIDDVFNEFVQRSKSCYSMGLIGTVDEMLMPFRGRCGFRMYMPNKPAKYGIKVQVLADAKTHYMVNAEIYSGKPLQKKQKSNLSNPTETVLRLIEPVSGSNRNITGDNWYSSLELVSELKKKNLTYVGTLKKNKTCIPPQFQPNNKREPKSSLFGFTSSTTLVSHVPKKGKAVILISSMHHDSSVIKETQKPEIIHFYNDTKSGVDALDAKCALYSTSRRTRRWPMCIFFGILNIAGVNSRVLFQFSRNGQEISRFNYLKELGMQLIHDHITFRIANTSVPLKIRDLASKITGVPIQFPDVPNVQTPKSKRKRCATCPTKSDRKTNITCSRCNIPICNQCSNKVCNNCFSM